MKNKLKNILLLAVFPFFGLIAQTNDYPFWNLD